ncbi:M23 family metallopeptidase [Haloarchaeobius litoreus]|uniref:M23 family metallopeptidase n=1 Tax=Haloarchaeobius litoreus TaxID=755306 RepID=A0ABD6DJW0_9EURY|nr:M23 family metallopeptidase [Haloarchaeobius litoreus]
MTNRSAEPSASRETLRTARSLLRRALLWFATLDFWVVFGGFVLLGVVTMRTERFESYAVVCFLLAGIVPVVLQTVDGDEDTHGYAYEIDHGERLRYVVSTLGWSVTPWGIVTQVLQFGGQLVTMVRYQRRYPNRERHVPSTTPSLPYDGRWTVVNGGVTEETSHSWMLVAQRYAYDFVVTDEDGATHTGDGTELEEYYAFGEPIRAPASGVVVKARDRLRDHPRPGSGWLEWRTWDVRGNHVVVRHADGEYSLLGHLRRGSVVVSPGDRVERGEKVGDCGNSGHSGEPHLHYQLQDHPNFWTAASLVPQFRDAAVTREDDRRDDHEFYRSVGRETPVAYLWAGDRVTNTGDTGSTGPGAS